MFVLLTVAVIYKKLNKMGFSAMLKPSTFLLLRWINNLQSDIIQTLSGPIRGTVVEIDGQSVHQYLGIPYAQPPVGDLRFKKPLPVQPWSETLEADTMPPACIQYAVHPFPWYDSKPGKSEDCLYLNIWVPEDTTVKKAVMFWIHGGALVHGSIRQPLYNGRALAAVGDVIVVTTSYRLGAFGLFTTNTDDAPANVALYDMLEALKWVNKNIEAFGGDPNEVTLFFESAGSVSVGLFCVSPLTQGLFKRAIMESGSPAHLLGEDNTTNLHISEELAEKVGCANTITNIFTSPDKVTECMRALYDMLEALKWVNKNIEVFGGDPNDVTIFGESAGSMAVGLFCVSPLTRGLFKRAIMESGSPAYLFSEDNTTNLHISEKLAEKVGCTGPVTNIFTSPDKVTKCMREVEALEIEKTLNSLYPNFGSSYLPSYGNDFLPENARLSLITGDFHDVSVLIGNNRDEGSVVLTTSDSKVFGFTRDNLPRLNISYAKNLLKDLEKGIMKNIPNKDLINQVIFERLKEGDYRQNLKIIYDVAGDFVIGCPAVYFAESYSRYGKNVFFYSFEHRPSTSPWAKWMGVAHFDEIQFVFGSALKGNKYTEEEIELSRLMMEMWSNFAKYGDPSTSKLKLSNNDLLQKDLSTGQLKLSNSDLLQKDLSTNELKFSNSDLLQRDPSTNELKLSNSDSLQSDLWSEIWPTYSRKIPLYLVINTNTRKHKQYKLSPHKENCDLFRNMFGFA